MKPCNDSLNTYSKRMMLQLFMISSGIVLVILCTFNCLSIDCASFGKVLFTCLNLYVVSFICQKYQILSRLGQMAELLACGILLSISATISTYLAISAGMPIADSRLAAMDQALDFDVFAILSVVDATPWLESILGFGYSSFTWQLMAVPVILVALNQTNRACGFVFGYGLLCFLSSVLAIWYPSLGTFEAYGIAASDYPQIRSSLAYFFLDEFHGVRDDADFVLTLSKSAGIITFPSVHAGVAILVVWALWTVPVLWIAAMALNVVMAASTISHGAHYLVDIIAAGGVAACTIIVIEALFLGTRASFDPRRMKIQSEQTASP